MAIKELSKYFSDDDRVTATVYFDLTEKLFRVSATSETGSSFTALFETEGDADQFAEGWVK